MTGAVEGSNKFANIGHKTVTKWGSKNDDGQRLDCYWNIAKESLSAGATDAEIAAEMQELMELNAEKDAATGEYDTALQEGEQILMTKEAAVNACNDAFEATSQQYDEAITALSGLAGELSQCYADIDALNSQIESCSDDREKET